LLALPDRPSGLPGMLIERLFNKLNNWRPIATRFDNGLSFLCFSGASQPKSEYPFVNGT
jgi:hypothetical protein